MNKLTIEDIATDKIRDERGLGYGIWDVSDSEEILKFEAEDFYPPDILGLKDNIKNKIVEFCNKYPDFRIGEAYQCYAVFLLSSPAKPFSGKHTGTGFNHGSSNLLEDCPKKLLILAEDD